LTHTLKDRYPDAMSRLFSPSGVILFAALLAHSPPVRAGSQFMNFDALNEGDLAMATPGTMDKEFFGIIGWSDSAGESPGVIVEVANSGEYRKGMALRGSGLADEYMGANPFLLPFDAETGGVVFDALVGGDFPVTVAHWLDLDNDGRFDQPETRMQAGVIKAGTAAEFGLQGAGFGAVVSSGIAPVKGKWYRIALIHGPADASGKRVIRMSAYNLSDGAQVDFDPGLAGVQPWESVVTAAFYGGDAPAEGLAVRVAGEASAIDEIGPLTFAKDGSNLLPLNSPRCWLQRLVPGPRDVARVDDTMSSSYRNSPLGGSMEVAGFSVGGNLQTLRVAATGGAQLSIGAAGIDVQGPVGAIQFGCDVLLSADQEWKVGMVSQFVPGIHFFATSDYTGPVMDLGGRTVTKSGPEDLWITGGYDVLNGTLICREGILAIGSGGTSGDLKLPSSVTLRAEDGGIISLSNVGAGVTASPEIHLKEGTLNLALGFSPNPLTLAGPLSVRGGCWLTYDNANLGVTSAVRYSLTGALTGDGTLQVVSTSPRPHADRIRFEGDNSGFTGRIIVTGASGNRTLQLRNPGSGSANADWQIEAGNTLEIFGVDVQLGSLQGGGKITNAHGSNPAGITVSRGHFSGQIMDGTRPLGLIKTSGDTLTLAGVNSYTGDTSVQAGKLSLRSSGLADGADVKLMTGALLDLDFHGTDQIDELFIDGVRQAAGTWGAAGSSAANISPLIAGNGILLVTAGSSTNDFAEWMARYPALVGADQNKFADPDGDGIENVLEWVLDGNPSLPDAARLLVASNPPGITLSFSRIEASLGQGLLMVEWSHDLNGPWNQIPIAAAGSGPDANGITVTVMSDPTPDQIRVTIPASNAAAGRLFTRLKFTN
jgi:autotransporter-associated beta strand protein